MIVVDEKDIVPLDSGYLKVGMTDGVRTIKGTNGVKGGYCRIILHCSICQKDEEMFGKGYFEVTRKNAKYFKGCGCSGQYSGEQKLLLTKRLIKEEGYTFRGLVGGDKVTSGTYLKLTCPKGHEYETTTISKFLDSNRRCPECSGNVAWTESKFLGEVYKVHKGLYSYEGTHLIKNSKTKFTAICELHGPWKINIHHHINRGQGCPHLECCSKKISEVKASTTEVFINKAKLVHKDTYTYSETIYHRSFSKVKIFCNECEMYFHQIASDHLSGYGCPSCAGRNQKQLYIFLISDNSVPVAIKVGIANHYKNRLSRQSYSSCYDVTLLNLFEFEDTEVCKDAERYCKTSLNNGVLSKEEYTDGYSETYSLKDLDKIKQIVLYYKGAEIEL